MTLVSKEIAEKDVNTWLDKQRVKPRARAEKEKDIESLIEAVMYGELSFDDDGHAVQALQFPIGGVNQLVYSSRITLDDISTKTKGSGGTDAFSIIAAYISASTGVAIGLLKKMDNSDMGLAGNVVAFF